MTVKTTNQVFYIVGERILIPHDKIMQQNSQLESFLSEPLTAPFSIQIESSFDSEYNFNENDFPSERSTVKLYPQQELGNFKQSYQIAQLYDLIFDTQLLRNAGRALQIAHHFSTHQYCGRCGNKMSHDSEALYAQCEPCDDVFYPRISPCMIVLVYKDDEILLAKRPNSTVDWYSLLAGFVEAGESLEQCIHREVYEEVKLKVGNIQYFSSQAWPFPNQLMVGYFAKYISGEIKVDGVELDKAKWFPINNLPKYPPTLSISGQLIEHFLKNKGNIQ